MTIRGRFSRLSLLWKILFSTSVAITVLFGVSGWIVQRHAENTTSASLEDEVKASFQAYESLWKSRADKLAAVSLVLSNMSDVRAAFSTGDQATIRDTAGELWAKVSDESAIFLVCDPQGRIIASLGGVPIPALPPQLPVVSAAAAQFPQQASGFMLQGGSLYQIAVTPVYVQSGAGPALLNVLVAGYAVDPVAAGRLKQSTGGSEFVFFSQGRVVASTLNARATAQIAETAATGHGRDRLSDGVLEYAPYITTLPDIQGKPVGELWILRSFEGARQRIAVLRQQMILIWLIAVVAGLALTYALARRIVEPVKMLDRAAAEVTRQNYDHRVTVDSQDELGRLGRTFNAMCESIQSAREELIRQERISTIGRLSSSIVHDLRNPLAAIYGGAEMLVDTELSQFQVKRLAANMYRASRKIQEMLQDLVNVARGKSDRTEICHLREIVDAACESVVAVADTQSVSIAVDVPEEIELPVERARMERVFGNLLGNAIEAMPNGGSVRISARIADGFALITVEDTGPGISPEIRSRLFQPFVSVGKRNGLGLGLALSRQTVIDQGGEMWVESEPGSGARFRFRLPVNATQQSAGPRERIKTLG